MAPTIDLNIIQNRMAGIALASIIAMPLAAETIEGSGTVCWTGDITFVGTSAADMGYTWANEWTFMPENKDPNMLSSGVCHGSGIVVNGTPEPFPYFCKYMSSNGSTHMSRVEGGDADANGIYFGGTGAYEGMTGTNKLGAVMPLPAAEGKLAGCRPASASISLPG
jgi:hypothetical protein